MMPMNIVLWRYRYLWAFRNRYCRCNAIFWKNYLFGEPAFKRCFVKPW